MHREQILDLLFPDTAPGESAKGLRSTVYLLRKLLDDAEATTSHLAWEGELLALVPALAGKPDAGWLDATAFDRAALAALGAREAAACHAALNLYGGEYLPEDRYEEWAERRREELRGRHLALLLYLADLAAASGDREVSARCLRTVLTVDPCHEDAARSLMDLLAAEGQRSEALEVYRALAAALEQELGQPPSRETRAVRARILAEAPVAIMPPARRTNLPAPMTSFVGRDWEKAEVAQALQTAPGGCRLVTLTGAGGCGKTRLAIEVARGLLDEYPDGVILVELAPLAIPSLLGQVVADAMGVRQQAGQATLEGLTSYLTARKLLLILDNCEHMAEACAALAAALLEAAPELRIIATSQATLGVLGEAVWRVPSLALPESDNVQAGDLAAYEAVQLFLERAQAARPRFALNERNAAAILQICRRLDGIPLAIELAAARLAALSPEQIAARLDDRFALLTGGNRTALPRQQTLRATLEWSYGLLSSAERILLGRLAVFAGGWTLEAAEAVCAGQGLPQRAVQGHLDALVARSLVQADEAGEEMRYRLLESVRAFAREQLDAAGELERTEAQHLDWFLRMAEEADQRLMGPEQALQLARLEREHDNLRVAVRWAETHGAIAQALRLATGIWRFWYVRGYFIEGRTCLQATIALGESSPDAEALAALRAKALYAAGVMYLELGDYDRTVALSEESLALSRRVGDTVGLSRALNTLGNMATTRGDPVRGASLHGEVLAIRRKLGDKAGMATSLYNLGCAYLAQGDYLRAGAAFEESLGLYRALGITTNVAIALMSLGRLARGQGDLARAAAVTEESLALRREVGDAAGIAQSLNLLGRIAADGGDISAARTYYEEALALYRSIQHRIGIADALLNLAITSRREGKMQQAVARCQESLELYVVLDARGQIAVCLEVLAGICADGAHVERGATLAGAAAALRECLGTPLAPADLAIYERDLALLRAALGDDLYGTEWATGHTMTLERAVAEAEQVITLAGLQLTPLMTY